MSKELYPVTGMIGKLLRGEEKVNYQTSPPCYDCKYGPEGDEVDKCDEKTTNRVAPYCSNFENLGASKRVKQLLKNKRK